MAHVTETDSRLSLDKFPAPRPVDYGWDFIVGVGPWSMADHAMARAGLAPCPACGGKPLRRHDYCLACDRSGIDRLVAEGKVELHAIPVGECLDYDYKHDGSKYLPDGSLDGGVGRRRRKARAAPVDLGLTKPPARKGRGSGGNKAGRKARKSAQPA